MNARNFIRISLSALLIFAICTLCSCSANEQKPEHWRIGVSQCSNDSWRTKMNEEIRREQTFNRGLEVEFRSADDNDRRQVADIDYFISQRVDLIVVAPNTANSIAPAVERAIAARIPVVLVDRNINGEGATAFIGADNHEIGRMAGRYIATRLNHKGKILEIAGMDGSSPAIDRHQGLLDALHAESDLKIVTTVWSDWTPERAKVLMDSVINEGMDFDLVFAHNDRMGVAAHRELKRLCPGRDALFVGIDAQTGEGQGVEAVRNGELDASFLYPTRGDKVIDTALKILRGEQYDKITTLPTALIDASNANVMIMQAKETDEQMKKLEWLNQQIDRYWDRYSAQQMLLYACITIILLFLVLLTVTLFSYRSKVRTAEMLAKQAKQLEEQREQVKAATNAKLAFFTNVSHDFRTPLTLIADPVRQVKDSERLSETERTMMRIANKNVNILLRLINQVLDLQKYDTGKMSLTLANADLKKCVDEWVASFHQLSLKKHIRLDLSVETSDNWIMSFDQEKMERIVFNLLSNAFKFTPENGAVHVRLRQEDSNVVMSVKDTGVGIPQSLLSKIFDSFYQINTRKEESSGIGLALVKAFVELHGGTIRAISESGKGSEFICTFPIRRLPSEEQSPDSLISEQRITDELEDIPQNVFPTNDEARERDVVLVVDDNKDMCTLIRTILSDTYNVIEAHNGRQGLTYANKCMPDVFICDVMMPEMDGFECCRRLKTELRTSHIPVLMLTACSFDEQRINAYDNGADAFIAKPFEAKMLLSRVESLIANRKRINNFLSDKMSITAPATERARGADIDVDFLSRLKSLINERIDDNSLSVEALGEQMGLSRVQLYRKVKSLTNYSPVELLRIMRLRRAQDLLKTANGLTVSEVCYKVGFSSPSYFAKCYKEYFGESPSASGSSR